MGWPGRKCCMCHEVLPLDRKRKKSFHSNTCKNVKATVRNLLSVPLKETNALNSSTATICYYCGKKNNYNLITK